MLHTSPPSRLSLVLLSLFISSFFTIFCVNQAVLWGNYAYPVDFDDVGYFADAMCRLLEWHKGTNFLQLHIESPPHSPIYTYIAMLGFSMFGEASWGPLAVTGGFIWAISFAVLTSFARSHLWSGILVLMAVLSMPYLGALVREFRPDMATGLAIGYGGYLITRKPWNTLPYKDWCFGGGLFGVGLLLKPAYSPVTLALLFAAMGASITVDMRAFFKRPRKAFFLIFLALLVALLVAGFHYYYAWKGVYNYIFINMLGSDKDIWFLKLTTKEQFLYYLTGFGGRHMVGWLAPIIPIICVIAVFTAFQQKDFKWLMQAIAYAVFTLVAYLAVSITSYMTPFLGAAFFGCLVVMLIGSSQYIFLNSCTRLVKFSVTFILLSYLSFTVFSTPRSTTVTHNPLSYHESLASVASDLHTFLSGTQTVVITGYERSFAGSTVLYQMLKKYRHAITIVDLHRERVFSNALKEIENSSAVITFKNPQTVHLPNASWQADIRKFLQTNSNFVLVGEYPLEKSTTVLVYVRKKLLEDGKS